MPDVLTIALIALGVVVVVLWTALGIAAYRYDDEMGEHCPDCNRKTPDDEWQPHVIDHVVYRECPACGNLVATGTVLVPH